MFNLFFQTDEFSNYIRVVIHGSFLVLINLYRGKCDVFKSEADRLTIYGHLGSHGLQLKKSSPFRISIG